MDHRSESVSLEESQLPLRRLESPRPSACGLAQWPSEVFSEWRLGESGTGFNSWLVGISHLRYFFFELLHQPFLRLERPLERLFGAVGFNRDSGWKVHQSNQPPAAAEVYVDSLNFILIKTGHLHTYFNTFT